MTAAYRTGWIGSLTLQSPPRCIAAFTAFPTGEPAAEIGSVDGRNFYWSLGCSCSGRSFVIRSIYGPHFYLKHPVAHGPITLRCVTCGREQTCFDPAIHGYDAELDLLPPPDADRDTGLHDFACPNCKASSFEVVARFDTRRRQTSRDRTCLPISC